MTRFIQKPDYTSQIDRLLDIMRYLRRHPDGCAWTQAQTHRSLAPYLLEETYETADVIDQGRHDDLLRDELGDILLQIAFHAEIADQRGAFSFDDVARAISDKLTRRYPTILGDEPNTLKTPEEIDRRWEEIKAEERRLKGVPAKDASILDEISNALPALVRASKLKGRMAKAGWEWPDSAMQIDKIAEEVNELRVEIESDTPDIEAVKAEFGDLMFLLVDFARYHGFDAEDALRSTNNRIERRFRYMESYIKRQGYDALKDSPRDVRLAGWAEAKKREKEEKENRKAG